MRHADHQRGQHQGRNNHFNQPQKYISGNFQIPRQRRLLRGVQMQIALPAYNQPQQHGTQYEHRKTIWHGEYRQ